MSTEGGGGDQTTTKKEEEAISAGSSTRQQQTAETGESSSAATDHPQTEPIQEGSGKRGVAHAASGESISATSSQGVQEEDKKLPARTDQPSDVTVPSTSSEGTTKPRQVIAVSASKGPAAFFNLARKFLVTDEMCDLSALEGAIVSAVDAAHLLERSKLARIVRIQTSYVTVEPKKKRQPQPTEGLGSNQQTSAKRIASVSTVEGAVGAHAVPGVASVNDIMHHPHYYAQQRRQPHQPPPPAPSRQRAGKGSGRELRRARIVITVKRTEEYTKWLEDNPLQAIIAGDGDEGAEESGDPPPTEEPRKPPAR